MSQKKTEKIRLVERRKLINNQSLSDALLDKLRAWTLDHGKSASLSMLKVQVNQAETHYHRFMEIEEKIIDLADTDDPIDVDDDERTDFVSKFEVRYVKVKANLMELIAEKSPKAPKNSASDQTQSFVASSRSIKLPNLKPPTFSGNYSEWIDFKNEFTSMIIDDGDLSDVDRFRFLKSCLTDSAKRTVSQMESSNENFKSAWRALVDRYENKALMFQSHINEILQMSNVKKESADGLRNLLDCVCAHRRALSSLGSVAEFAENVLICIMLSKIDVTSAMKWEETTTKEIPTWDGFSAFLEKRASILEKIEYNKGQMANPTHAGNSYSRPSRTKHSAFLLSTGACVKCNSNEHSLSSCPGFLKSTPKDRFQDVKKNRLCVKCLKSKHRIRFCKAPRCDSCQKPHHNLLHFNNDKPTSIITTSIPSTSKTSFPSAVQQALITSNVIFDQPAILATAIVNVLDNRGCLVPGRALLDSGATTNFVTERFIQSLNIEKQKAYNCIGGIGANNITSKAKCILTISSQYESESYNCSAIILSKIAGALPSFPISTTDFVVPPGLNLADPSYSIPQQVDLLLGSGVFWSFLMTGKIVLGDGMPILQETKLGWIIAGSMKSSPKPNLSALTSTFDPIIEAPSMKLEDLVQRFWEIDDVNSMEKKVSLQHQLCEDHYATNTRRDANGVYIVKLPFTENPSCLGESLKIAMRRFVSLEKRLEKQPEAKEMYSHFIDEYKKLNHLEVVEKFDPAIPHCFLPHHCVYKLSSSSTKLRVVFDGSCKTSSGISLNEILHTGPKLQDDLFVILLRFRLFKYVLTGDIQNMYRQIQIKEPDSNFQLILWRKTPTDPIQVLRLSTVTYGTAPGSYLAIKTLFQLADDEGDDFPMAAQVLRRNFYVDDMMVGADSIPELQEIMDQIVGILRRGGFTLSKFCSNEENVLSSIDFSLREKFLCIDEKNVVKALGLIWQPDRDVFRYSYKAPSESSSIITKRSVLSEIASLFDPLGLVCPVVTLAKIFYQDLWKLKLDWDEHLDNDLCEKWKKFRKQLSSLKEIAIGRYVMTESTYRLMEIHAFSDASEKAYGACVYLRCVHFDDSITCRLFCAKSRVAPTKSTSIARLELLAAKLLADLVTRLKNEILNDSTIHAEYFWTDSLITLCWINAEPHNWTVFVANRVAKIQQMTHPACWRHVPGELNPADLISRGMHPSQIASSDVWFSGPSFLQNSSESWPAIPPSPTLTDDMNERRPMKFALVSRELDDLTTPMNFSLHFRGCRRAFAYVLRFIKNCRSHQGCKERRRKLMTSKDDIYSEIPTPTLPGEEEAEKLFIRSIQIASFAEEYKLLRQNRSVANNSKVKCLAPFIDQDGLMRVGGRIKRANIPYDSKHQILLPKDHLYTICLIRYFHRFRTFHSGPHIVLTAIRARYWPINGLVQTRNLIRKCTWCFRMKPLFFNQIMGDLPRERLDYKNVRPFMVSGVDFAGPLTVRHHARCKVLKKVYVALFICFSTKAVHLELVIDLSTEAFIRALKRFVADRGKVIKIFSDNATNFQGTSNQLRDVQRMLLDRNDSIKAACDQNCVEWSFIPPRSPNFGGLWEASIKISKKLIRNVLGSTEVSVDELHTVLRQVAAIINSRPITPISSDPNDFEPLTPGHFLYGGPPSALPELAVDEDNVNRVRLYQRICWMNQTFWRRFRDEYLSSMQPRTKWMTKSKNIFVGDMVLLKDYLTPPLKWSLGRVAEIQPDADGNVRIVKIQTASGVKERSISGISLLPMEK